MSLIRASKNCWLAIATVLGMAGCAAEGVDPPSDVTPDVTSAEDTALGEGELRQWQCTTDTDCAAPGACLACADGSAACPSALCQHHRCTTTVPSCPPLDACASVRCAAGTHCTAGKCLPDTTVACGGFAGLACPGSGKCVDDPRDSCDPAHGGADCSGLCSCVDNVLCALGHHFDASPKVCACVPDPLGGGSCGGNTCGQGQYCCNASCGMCAPIGAACIQIACASPS